VAVLQARVFRYSTVGEGDVGVLHHPQRYLTLDLGRAVAGIVFLDDESLDLLVGDVAGVNNDVVAPTGITRPALASVDHPLVSFALRRSFESNRIRSMIGFRKGERPDFLESGHLRQIALLLLFGAEQVDRLHRQSEMNGEESRDARVYP